MTTDTLQVALIQAHLIWENPIQNRLNFETKIKEISSTVDVIVLPEMFTSGFTMQPSNVAESMSGETVEWMQKLAVEKDAMLMGSLVIHENDTYYNRLVAALPNGELHWYDKRHTFTLAGEHKVYAAGSEKLMFTYKGWKICPLICYDLRFPVWARNTETYDVLIYVANWPKPRISAWDALLKARAIENMSYTIGVNRVGLDANNLEYPGHCACYDVLGEKIAEVSDNTQGTTIVTLQKSHIELYRNKLRFLEDRDQFTLV